MSGKGMYDKWDAPTGSRGYERPHGACSFLVFLGLLATSCFVGYAVWMIGLSLSVFGR